VGHKREAHDHHTFADIVDAVTTANPDLADAGFEPIYSPIDEGGYTDKHGTRWRLRGGELRWARIQHLLLDHQVPVLHVYMGDVREIADDDRADFLSVVRPYLKGVHVPPPGDDYTDYVAAEFKDDQHTSLLVVEELC
jgi:hypothetical protein